MIVVSATTLSPAGVSAATAPTVSDAGVTDSFPNGMTFTVNASSDSPINELKIRYKILPDGTSANGSPKFEPGTSVAATFNLGGADLYLPPGTVIEYHWEATDADGDESRTETATFFYDDARFQWAPLEANGVTIFYYSGSEQDAQKMLETASETIGSMSQLLGANITFPIKVWIYKSRDDMRPALQRRSATFEQQITTLGVRVSSDTVLVLGNSDLDTLRHELTHVVTHIAGESALGRLPAWLDEGTAVYGQGDPGGFGNAVDQAISRGNVFSVRQITSSPGDPAGVNLFYGQSWSLVKYLNDTYGPEKFAKLFAEIKKGNTVDDALKAAYGFDQDGLDNEWRAAHGLPPRATEEPKQNEQPQTTAGASGSQNTSQNDDGGGTSTFVLVALAVGLLVLAGAVGLAGWAVARRL
jgi:Peptidase MA superfamily